MEYLIKLFKEQKEKSESKKVAKFTEEIERDIAERNEKRKRRLTEINREIGYLNRLIQSLNTSYTTKLKPASNLPKAPNTKIFISDALKNAVSYSPWGTSSDLLLRVIDGYVDGYEPKPGPIPRA